MSVLIIIAHTTYNKNEVSFCSLKGKYYSLLQRNIIDLPFTTRTYLFPVPLIKSLKIK